MRMHGLAPVRGAAANAPVTAVSCSFFSSFSEALSMEQLIVANLDSSRVDSRANHVPGTSDIMLAELEDVREELFLALGAMDAVTGSSDADRYQVSAKRLRLSQVGLKSSTAWGLMYQYLMPRIDPGAAAALGSLQRNHLEMMRHSSVHIGEWTLDRIEADWNGYRDSYRSLRSKLTTHMSSEKRLLYPILQVEAQGGWRHVG